MLDRRIDSFQRCFIEGDSVLDDVVALRAEDEKGHAGRVYFQRRIENNRVNDSSKCRW